MPRRLPPLNALRAFEAAARHLSFTKAAEELFVTQAAVSHQVKALEEHLGMGLFRRLNRRLMLTDAGQAYLPALRDAFDGIERATRRLSVQESDNAIRVTTMASFGSRWLVPRLSRFRNLHPDYDVLVSIADRVVNLEEDGFDIGLRYGGGRYPGYQVTHLMDDEFFVVCSPKLLEGPHPLREPADLKYHTLLHDDVSRSAHEDQSWRAWLLAAGVTEVDPNRGPGFSDSHLVVQAAVDGLGVALGRRMIVSLDLEEGRLVRPFGGSNRTDFSYYMVVPHPKADFPKIKAFREWLVKEAAAIAID